MEKITSNFTYRDNVRDITCQYLPLFNETIIPPVNFISFRVVSSLLLAAVWGLDFLSIDGFIWIDTNSDTSSKIFRELSYRKTPVCVVIFAQIASFFFFLLGASAAMQRRSVNYFLSHYIINYQREVWVFLSDWRQQIWTLLCCHKWKECLEIRRCVYVVTHMFLKRRLTPRRQTTQTPPPPRHRALFWLWRITESRFFLWVFKKISVYLETPEGTGACRCLQ